MDYWEIPTTAPIRVALDFNRDKSFDWDASGTGVSQYENITDRVLSAAWDLGIHNPDDRVASEGTFTLKLDNDDRVFSPAWVDGPLYGYLEPGIMAVIELQAPDGTWIRRFTGLVEDIVPSPGASPRETEIKGIQGMTLINELSFVPEILTDVTTDEALKWLLNTWAPFEWDVWLLNVSKLNVNTRLPSDDRFLFDEGYVLLPYYGETWLNARERKGTRTEVTNYDILGKIKDLVEAEQGYFWLDEDGMANFLNRFGIFANLLSPEKVLDLDVDVQSANIQYGVAAGLYNDIRVNYYPKRDEAAGLLVWSDKTVTIGPGETVTEEIKGTGGIGDNRKITIIDDTIPTVGVTYTGGTPIASGSVVDADTVRVVITNQHVSNDCQINTIAVSGHCLTSEDAKEATALDTSSIADHRQRVLKVDLKELPTETIAEELAKFILKLRRFPRMRVASVTLNNRDSAWYATQTDLRIGDHVLMSETQTGLEDWMGVVSGFSFDWQPQLLTTTIDFVEAYTGDFWVLGTSALGTGTVV